MSTILKRRTEQVSNFLDIPGCEFTETTLTINEKLSQEHWERLGQVLKRVESGVQWWIGDWMAYGEKHFSEKYAQAIDVSDQTGINVDTLRNYQWVSEHVPPVMRITTVPWSFHQVIAALPPKEQRKWLKHASEMRAAGEKYSYRDLKRDVEREERNQRFQLVKTVMDRIWERIQDGCYTPEAIMKCSECGSNIFGLEQKEIELYMQQLVGSGKCEWRDQGGKTDVARGESTQLCVPKDLPVGSDFSMPGYRPHVEYGEDDEEHF